MNENIYIWLKWPRVMLNCQEYDKYFKWVGVYMGVIDMYVAHGN